ncbi:Rhodanese-like domain-containing protein [Corynascus novoguineensis]|uniref:Rhodanese-like domain-containing protein n=1 Tax=Corynascus novoguineensis TaxID=1126955 RepID=A0AAN7CZQ9_9PEZI|nr:Rhodanese-like domain-containing protein [Corynascus novoguineensis]
MATIGTLQRLSAASLSKLLLAAQEAATAGDPTIAVIDVRDDDYIGGHIKGSLNVPSHTLDAMLPTLVRQLQDKETVVFHCALSQQRGPSAALRYLRERERILGAIKAAAGPSSSAEASDTSDETTAKKEQKVFVLDRGFVGWQEVYGTDERLTEGYRKELWENGYWG